MFTTDNIEKYNYNNEKVWSLQRDEIGLVMWEKGVLYDNANKNPKKVHVPSIMGKSGPDDDPKVWTEGVSDSIFVNDTRCKPAVSPLIQLQNFITIYHYDNDYFQHKWLNNLAEMKLEVRNGDIDDIHITNKLDKSYCFDCSSEHPSCHPVHACGLMDYKNDEGVL